MDSMYDPTPSEGDEAPTKKVRHRKKQFLQTIRRQMEFYFSDANLSKNRFLGQLVAEDPEVDLSRFLQFNKIRELTNDLKDIQKALKKSEMLALTDDDMKVYRKTAIKLNDQTDESTIYVERLPPDADHEWLRSVFLPYGDVPYVSIPKYPHNGLNKGFAFVEFNCPESAARALDAFGAMGCRLTSEIPPDQICSNRLGAGGHHRSEPAVGMDPHFKVPSEKNIKKKSKGKVKKLKSETTEDHLEDQGNENKSKQSEKRRKISFDDEQELESKSESYIGEERKYKKVQVNEDIDPMKTELKMEGSESPKKGHKKIKEQAKAELEKSVNEELDVKSPESEIKHSKKRKQKSQLEEQELTEQNLEEEEEGTIAKHSKRQKREVADEPEVRESETEQASKDSKDDEKENEGNEVGKKRRKNRHHKKKNKKEKTEPEQNINLRVLSKLEWKRLRNKYLDLQKVRMTQLKQHLHRSRAYDHSRQRQEAVTAVEKPKKTEKKFTFTPGVIIQLKFPEPLDDVKKFKTDAKTNPDIKYVDAQEGWNEAYIRCSTTEAASEMVAQQLWSHMDILTGNEETAYWEKMNHDRELKCGRNERVKVRGKTKLLAKVEKAVGKHIRFTTDEEVTPKG